MTASYQMHRQYVVSYDSLFVKCQEAVKFCGFNLQESDSLSGYIKVKARMSWKSVGEEIELRINYKGIINVRSISVVPTTIFDYGKNKANVESLFSTLDMLLGSENFEDTKSPGIDSTSKTSTVDTLSILLLAADPTNASRLRIGEEFREIQEKLQLSKLREKFRIEQRTSIRPTDLSQVLLDLQPQILHFSGHGLEGGALCLENQIGQIHPISPEALAALFEQFKDQVKCILLNACYSEIQAIAVSEHIDYVIGMNKAIGDKAAIAFAIGFYQGLGAGRTIEGAYKLGCVQVGLQSIPEHLTPVLVKRGEVQT